MTAESDFKHHQLGCPICADEIMEKFFCPLGKNLLYALIAEDPAQSQYWVLERDAITLGGLPNKSRVANDWKPGKTTESIAFINQAESIMAGVTSEEQKRLQKEIDLLKSGQKILRDWISVSDFLNNP